MSQMQNDRLLMMDAIENELNSCRRKIDHLESALRRPARNHPRIFIEIVEELRNREFDLSDRLRECRSAGEMEWIEMKPALETAWTDLRISVDSVWSRFHEVSRSNRGGPAGDEEAPQKITKKAA